jgi:pimeloyl-ACP methyl ester carboxylesterase
MRILWRLTSPEVQLAWYRARVREGAVVLTHRIDGAGPPLVLLNGGFMSIGSWESFLAPLVSRFRVVRCDLRGQLLSPGPYPDSLDGHAGDVMALLDSLGIATAHVAGVSFGAEVAMQLAAQAPGRVDRLTVISATDRTTERMRIDARAGRRLAEQAAAGRRDAAEELLRRVFADTWSEHWLAAQRPDFLESRLQQIVGLPPAYFAGAAALLGVLDSIDLTPLLGRVTASTMVLGGALDLIFPPEHSRAIAHAIPGARLEILPDTGHGLLIERADRVLELLLS